MVISIATLREMQNSRCKVIPSKQGILASCLRRELRLRTAMSPHDIAPGWHWPSLSERL